MHWETKKKKPKIRVTCFIEILVLLQWSGTKATISLRYAYKHASSHPSKEAYFSLNGQ